MLVIDKHVQLKLSLTHVCNIFQNYGLSLKPAYYLHNLQCRILTSPKAPAPNFLPFVQLTGAVAAGRKNTSSKHTKCYMVQSIVNYPNIEYPLFSTKAYPADHHPMILLLVM